MQAKQKRGVETFERVVAFVDEHPVAPPLSYGRARETLGDVVRRLREYAGVQVSGREGSRGELRRQAQLVEQLLVQHMRPIVALARAEQGPDADVRLPISIGMPRVGVGVSKILQACDGIIDAVRPHEAVLVAAGRPADFLARMTATRDELAGIIRGRATHVGRHVGARRGLQVQIRRGRRVVEALDAVVRAAFLGDEVTLTRWRTAKRLYQVPGASAVPVLEEVSAAA